MLTQGALGTPGVHAVGRYVEIARQSRISPPRCHRGYSRGSLVAVGAADSALLHAFVKRGPFLAGEMLNFPTMRVRVCVWVASRLHPVRLGALCSAIGSADGRPAHDVSGAPTHRRSTAACAFRASSSCLSGRMVESLPGSLAVAPGAAGAPLRPPTKLGTTDPRINITWIRTPPHPTLNGGTTPRGHFCRALGKASGNPTLGVPEWRRCLPELGLLELPTRHLRVPAAVQSQ